MKKFEEPVVMRELREIRRRQYEETKDLSMEERIAYDKKLSDDFRLEHRYTEMVTKINILINMDDVAH